MKSALLALTVLFAAAPASAGEPSFGAVASAPLERGGYSVFATAGFPRMQAGFRAGYQQFELGAELGMDYAAVDFYGAATARRSLVDRGPFNLAADVKIGAFGDAGAKWIASDNRPGVGLRFEVGSSLTYQTAWPIAVIGFIKVPIEVPVTADGNVRVAPLAGLGAEMSIGHGCYLLLEAGAGPDFRTRAVQTTRLGLEGAFGFGYRVF